MFRLRSYRKPHRLQQIHLATPIGSQGTELDAAGIVTGHILNDASEKAIAYLGAGTDRLQADAVTYAGAINNGRAVYAYQTILDVSEDGLSTEELPGHHFAAKVCGLAAGFEPQTPLTRKAINVRGVKLDPADSFDLAARETLLAAGVIHLVQFPGTSPFVINQGITTLLANKNLWDATTQTSSEISLMRIADILLRDIRLSAADTFVGSTASIGRATVENFVKSFLNDQIGALITSWSGLVVNQVADRWEVEFAFTPNGPINFVIIVGTVIGGSPT